MTNYNNTGSLTAQIDELDKEVSILKNERKVLIFEKERYYSVDFMNSNIKRYIKSSNKLDGLFAYKEFSYKQADSLKEEISNFILSCLGEDKPLVDGEQGMKAVEVATTIYKLL